MVVEIGSTIGRVKLRSPLILGSFDAMISSDIFSRCFELCGDSLGAIVTKSTTLNPRQGYAEPRVASFGDGLLVASGNRNPGIHRMAEEVRKFRSRFDHAHIIGSIVSDPDHPQSELAEEYSSLAEEYAQAGVDGLELNLSCPHLDPDEKERTIVPAQDAKQVSLLVGSVKARLNKAGYPDCLLIPKLTGRHCNPVEVALSAERAGADAVTLSNLFPGTGYHTGLNEGGAAAPRGQQPGDYLVAHGKGGYSGRAMHSAVLLMIESVRHHVQIPVVGTGGCASDLNALVQTFMAGAVAVESVTPFYFNNEGDMSGLVKVNQLAGQLEGYLRDQGLENLEDLYQLRINKDLS